MADQYNLDAPVNAAQSQRTGNQGFLGGLQSQTSDFLNRYKGLLGSQETTTQAASRLGNQFGLPQLQQNANTLRTAVQNIPSTYKDATTGYDVNNNQLQRLIGQKTYELTPAMNTAENALSSAQNNVSTLLGYNQADLNRQTLPYQMEGQLLPQQQGIAANLWTSANQNELNALQQKNQLGVQLSEGEANRLNELKLTQQQGQNQLAGIAANQRYVPLGYGGVYDTQTGQTLDSSRLASIGAHGIYDPISGQVIYGNGGGSSSGGGGGGIAPSLNTGSGISPSFNYSNYVH